MAPARLAGCPGARAAHPVHSGGAAALTVPNRIRQSGARLQLEVVFNSGKTWRYIGVPQTVYEELLAAESKGRFMHAHIIGVYPDYLLVRRRRR